MIENKELKSKDEVIKTIETQEKGIPKAQTIPNEEEKLKETTTGQLLEAESTTNKISHQKAQTTKEVKISPPADSSQEKSQRYQNQKRQNPRQRERQNNRKSNQRPKEFEEKVVNISRVTNVVKGGRRFSFSVLVVIGDKKGRVAQGHGKAKEVPEAIKKAIKDAKRNLIKVPIVDGRTIPHIIQAKFVSSKILLKPATKGRGIIASGVVRSVVELAGYHDIVTKSLGSSNKTNAVKATLKALSTLKTAKEISDLRS